MGSASARLANAFVTAIVANAVPSGATFLITIVTNALVKIARKISRRAALTFVARVNVLPHGAGTSLRAMAFLYALNACVGFRGVIMAFWKEKNRFAIYTTHIMSFWLPLFINGVSSVQHCIKDLSIVSAQIAYVLVMTAIIRNVNALFLGVIYLIIVGHTRVVYLTAIGKSLLLTHPYTTATCTFVSGAILPISANIGAKK